MMKRRTGRRILSVLLALVMMLSLLPASVFASDTVTATKISSADQLTSGQYVLVNEAGYAPTVLDGGWVTPTAVTASGDTVEVAPSLLWTITVTDGGVTLTDSKGQTIAPKGGDANGIKSGSYTWTAACSGGTFTFAGQDTDTVTFSGNSTPTSGENRFRAYKNSTVTGKYSSSYPCHFTLYKYDAAPAPDPTPDTLCLTQVSELKDGMEVVFYYPEGKTAISGTADGKKLAAAETAQTTDGLTVAKDAGTVFTVSVDANGSYTFLQGGKYLTAGATGNSLSLADAPSDYSLWTLEATDGGFFIRSVNAQYNGNAQYVEFYNGFTVYGMNANKKNIYTFQLFTPAQSKTDPVTGLSDGDEIAIYNDASGNAIGSEASGSRMKAVASTLDGDLLRQSDGMAVFTVQIDDSGALSFLCGGKYLTAGETGSSLSLAAAASDYSLWTAEKNGDAFYLKSVNASYSGKAQYLEYYTTFTTYGLGSGGKNFAMTFRKLAPASSEGGLPAPGAQVVLYNQNAAGVLAAQNDTLSINMAAATVADGKATPANGAVIFTVEKNGEYYRFKNESYGYLCSNGTGNNAFYSKDFSEDGVTADDADWLVRSCSGGVGGYEMESRTAKYNGKYSQWLEYYADSFKTYSMYNVTDYTIYSFYFYGVADGVNVTRGIVNAPSVDFGTVYTAYVGQDYTLTFTIDAPFGVAGDVTVTLGGKTLPATLSAGTYSVTIPAADISGDKLTVSVSAKDAEGVSIAGTVEIPVLDEPVISDLTPTANAQTGDNKRPEISAAITNEGSGATVTMTVNGETVSAVCGGGRITYTPAADMDDGRVSVTVTVTRADGKSASKTWSFTVGESQYQLYFGQLHSHTTYSDGSGTLDSALDYIRSLPASANVQFVAFTDHSNYFDSTSAANPEGALYDMSLASASSQKLWSEYKDKVAAFNASQSDVVAIGGFEMTWSGGPGHINTFNTPGIVSRNNATLNNKTDYAGMKAYYALLDQAEGADSISQFNHPGTTFGTFGDFSFWDPVTDTRIAMVEVGNGEGQIGAGGYYPSYEYYIMALDKGWHVAPTNNQDNHKGKWGNANDARDVILTDDFSEQGIYEAIRAMRMYATEDKNLAVSYTVNGEQMGSSITVVPDQLTFDVTVYDPDKSDSISKAELVANSGKVVYTWDDPAQLAAGALTATLSPDYSYYFVRVTEGDGDLAVTSPVWVGESLKLGISSLTCATATPVTGEELELTTTLFNSEAADAAVKSLTYTIGSHVIGTDMTGYTIGKSSTLDVSFRYTPTEAKVTTVTVTAVVVLDGKEYTFTKTIDLDVLNADELVYIGIDGSHHNEYVAGNYKDSMGNFGNLAALYSVRTVQLNTSDELIAACSNPKFKAIVLTAPSRRDGTALRSPYDNYTDSEIAAVNAFNLAGGTVILAGWSDYYECYASFPAEDHMAAQQNRILSALGSSLRISDDGTLDDVLNGGQNPRLYFSTYNFDHPLLSGIEYDPVNPNDKLYTERFSQYGGASIYAVDADGNPVSTLPSTVSPMVYGHATTYSKDQDSDGLGGANTPKYAVADGDNRLLVMATEQLDGRGMIVVSGAAFLSNFEVQVKASNDSSDNDTEKNYSNYRICENLVQQLNPVKITPISEVQKQTEAGYKYTIEGVVTSNASGYDKDTAFFDCIYVQDSTGGINCFPVAGNFKIGDRVRVSGTTDFYQGELELQVTSITKIGEGEPVVPTEVTAAQVNDGSVLGSLITLRGFVESFELENGLVQTIMVRDKDGNVARVFIDGYITTAEDVKNLAVGCEITVTGLASYDNTFNAPDGPFPRIRIRDRADVVCTEHTHDYGEWTVTEPATCTTPGVESSTCACGDVLTREIPALGHTDADNEGKCDVCGASVDGNTPGGTTDPGNKPGTGEPGKPGTATGDTSGFTLWLALLSASALAGAALLRGKKRRA